MIYLKLHGVFCSYFYYHLAFIIIIIIVFYGLWFWLLLHVQILLDVAFLSNQ